MRRKEKRKDVCSQDASRHLDEEGKKRHKWLGPTISVLTTLRLDAHYPQILNLNILGLLVA